MHQTPHRWILAALLLTLGLMTGAPVAATPLPPDTPRIYLPLVIRQPAPQPPLYRLVVAEDDLEWLYDPVNRWTYETVPGVFLYDGVAYEVEVRFRGGTVRYLSKKSWKIDFPAATPFQGQRELNLNAEYTDKSYLREHLAYSVFHAAGFPAARTRYVRLEVNGDYMGLYLQVEQIDPHFLHRVGWDPNGNLYKGDYGGNFNWGGVDYEEAYVKKTNKEDSHRDLIDLLWRINLTQDEAFAAALAEELDVGRYLDWYAVQIAIGNYEWLEKNYYLYHQLAADWWAFVPWDLDLTLGHNWGMNGILDEDSTWDNPIDSGTTNSPKADGKWNKLITRVLDDEALRFAYCRRLRALLHGPFTEAALYPQIDATYNYIRAAAEADPYKWGTNDEFQAGPAELKTYIAQRRIWLLAQMPAYCPASGPMPVINEVQWPRPISTTDALSVTPWIELYNPAVVSFDAGGMRLRAPTTGTLFLDWTIPPETVIPPGGFLRIWADGLGAGDAVTLVDAPLYGDDVIDRVAPLSTTLSNTLWGRRPDGAEAWITLTHATPGGSNLGRAPMITATRRMPIEPQAGQPVTVTAHISDADALRWDETITPTLHWHAEGRAHHTPLRDDGQHGDGAPGDRVYGALLPGLAAGEVLTYHLRVTDTAGLASTDPARAPEHTYAYIVGFERPPIHINELVAINRDAGEDESGESADWFELYNSGDVSVTLGGMYLTDALENTTHWQIPAGIVAPPGGHVFFWADGEPDEGPLHTNFELDGDSGRVALYAGASGYSDHYHALIDEVFYGPQTVDQAWGRFPDGEEHWGRLAPTPGSHNIQPPPEITAVRHEPRAPSATAPVRVRAHITDDTAVVSATLHWQYDQSAGGYATPMMLLNGSAGEYAADIPAPPGGTLALGTTVAYTITAVDEAGNRACAPNGAPEIAFGYQIGAAPPLVLNELMAANDKTIADARGGYDDWFELYNRSAIIVELRGYFLSDALNRPPKWRMPSGTSLAPGEHLLVWADDAPGEGSLHAPFKLSRDGETLALFTACGAGRYCALDWITFGPQVTDVSLARLPDGAPAWQATFDPTPGGPNPTP